MIKYPLSDEILVAVQYILNLSQQRVSHQITRVYSSERNALKTVKGKWLFTCIFAVEPVRYRYHWTQEIITVRQQSIEGNIFSSVSVSVVSVYLWWGGGVPEEDLGHPGHVQTWSTWTSLYNPLPNPQTCSNMFTMQLLLSASGQLTFD